MRDKSGVDNKSDVSIQDEALIGRSGDNVRFKS